MTEKTFKHYPTADLRRCHDCGVLPGRDHLNRCSSAAARWQRQEWIKLPRVDAHLSDRHDLVLAKGVADELVCLLAPHCERMEVAGSIRRRRSRVKDIELLCVSKVWSSQDLFGGLATNGYELDLKLDKLIADGAVLKKRLNKRGNPTYGEKNKLLTHVPSGIPVDIFSVPPANWGMALVVRTGPTAFNIRLMARFKEMGMRGHAYGGVTDQVGTELECPDEATVFRLLGWPWIPPEWRRG